jgi:EpsG family
VIAYWAIYALPAMIALFEGINRHRGGIHPVAFLLFLLFFVMAFRQSGGDYATYLNMYESFAGITVIEWSQRTEPLYGFLNWASNELGWGLYGVNGACALIFTYGLYRFALDEPKPLLLVAIAMPYLAIVTAIGYTRQGTAIGLFMLGLTYLRRKQPIKYAICVLLAMGFHTSAIITAPLVYFAVVDKFAQYRRPIAIAGAALGGYVAYAVFADRLEFLVNVYASESSRYESSGALQRSLLNGIAGVTFLLMRTRWKAIFDDYNQYYYVAFAAIASVPLSLAYSTAIDRLGLFFLPFQLIVFSRLPLLQRSRRAEIIFTALVLIAYGLVLFVWLHLGQHSQALWLPFRNAILGEVL